MYTPLDQQEQVNETKNMQQRKDDLTQKVNSETLFILVHIICGSSF